MATYYSDQFAATYNATWSPSYRAPSPIIGPPTKIITFNNTAALSVSDLLVLGMFKSSDRFKYIYGSNTTTPTTGAINLGVYEAPKVGVDPVTVLDADLFCSAVDLATTAVFEDWFIESTTLTGFHRGLPLWQLLNVGGATSYTVDPKIDMLLVGVVTTAIDTADTIRILVDYDMVGC